MRRSLRAVLDSAISELSSSPAFHRLIDEVVQYLAHHPDVEALIQEQTTSFVEEAVDDLRAEAARADTAVDRAMLALRRPLRWRARSSEERELKAPAFTAERTQALAQLGSTAPAVPGFASRAIALVIDIFVMALACMFTTLILAWTGTFLRMGTLSARPIWLTWAHASRSSWWASFTCRCRGR